MCVCVCVRVCACVRACVRAVQCVRACARACVWRRCGDRDGGGGDERGGSFFGDIQYVGTDTRLHNYHPALTAALVYSTRLQFITFAGTSPSTTAGPGPVAPPCSCPLGLGAVISRTVRVACPLAPLSVTRLWSRKRNSASTLHTTSPEGSNSRLIPFTQSLPAVHIG